MKTGAKSKASGTETEEKNDLSPQDKEKLIDDMLEHGWTKIHLIAQWCGHLSRLCDELLVAKESGGHWREGLFWIRLWAVVVELHGRFEELKATGGFAANVASTIEQIRAKFSEDDLVLLDYMRQTNCHIVQEGYRRGLIETKSGPKLRDAYTVQTIPKKFSITDLSEVVTRMTKKYRADHTAMAKDFAGRVHMLLEELWSVTNAQAQDHQSRGFDSSLRPKAGKRAPSST